jgi:hypothetical protein
MRLAHWSSLAVGHFSSGMEVYYYWNKRRMSTCTTYTPFSSGSSNIGCSTTSGKGSSVSLVQTPTSVYNSSSVGTPDPVDPSSLFPPWVRLSPNNKPLSRKHELASSPYRFSLCNSCSLSSVLPSLLISFCNWLLLCQTAFIWFIHQRSVMSALLIHRSALALTSSPPPFFRSLYPSSCIRPV